MKLQQVDYLKTNTGGATFDTIVVDTFRRMQVVKPSLDVITQFTNRIDAGFEQVNTPQRQTANLQRLSSSNLRWLLCNQPGSVGKILLPTRLNLLLGHKGVPTLLDSIAINPERNPLKWNDHSTLLRLAMHPKNHTLQPVQQRLPG